MWGQPGPYRLVVSQAHVLSQPVRQEYLDSWMSILAAPGHNSVVNVVMPVSLAPTDLGKTLLTAENIKFGA